MKFAFYKGQRGKFTKANRALTSMANIKVGVSASLGFNNTVIYTDGGTLNVLMLGDRMLRTSVIYVKSLKPKRIPGKDGNVTFTSVSIDTDIVGYGDLGLTSGFRVLGERIVNEINRGTFDVAKLIYCRDHGHSTVTEGLAETEPGEEFYVKA
ncbi:hypothetical protein 2050HW_00223 [Serratia phage vB_SmaM_ 2050HW]|uniref:Uncharacterized protein n=1 Tax=Serratia phage vB_SmaM_ 2050HW TaxID=2024252 RepID=A0A289ZU18_9CAUD|nr:hypothetical protein HWB23_gp223 [Serratia phage vB_SmaM_ 2050HW]ATA65558.1 hypothetical protein 2050HW_00223 [Serratia phage vB_SmaM_ 2050HW]UCR74813.1 hypothetical protein [Serratia phage BUCT660]UQT03682.1 hypothetical protein KODAMA_02150 [Serratia phage vB_SmaM-Kodama]URG14074.1 hypothetical protein [Pectobacterium phage vB_ParM-25]